MTLQRRLVAVFGGVVLGVGADQAEGEATRPGLLLAGLGIGLLVAALVRE